MNSEKKAEKAFQSFCRTFQGGMTGPDVIVKGHARRGYTAPFFHAKRTELSMRNCIHANRTEYNSESCKSCITRNVSP
jgi:hypothetical protein